jgi:drug/metabolite transporter (DMT)-like permease
MMNHSLWALMVGTGACLGLSIPLAKLAAQAGASAMPFATAPTAVAALVFLGWALAREARPTSPWLLVRFGLIAGALGHALPMSLLFWLTASVGAGYAALAFTMPAIFTLALSLALRFEAPNARRAAAVVLGLGGALALVLARGVGATDVDLVDLLVLLTIPLSIGAGNLYRSRSMPAGAGSAWLACAVLGASSLMLALGGSMADAFAATDWSLASPYLLAQVAALVAGYFLYFALQRRAEPVTFAFMGYVSMAGGLVSGVLWFGEPLPLLTLPALGVMLGALMLLRSAPTRQEKRE